MLRLGYVPSVGPTLLPPLVHAFAARAPDVRLELVPGDAQHLSERLDAADVLDAALLPTAASGDAFGSVLLAEDPFVLVGPPGEALPLASGLAALPLLAGDPCPVQAEHEAELRSSHGRLVRLDDAPTVVALVAAGCAYGLLPGSAVGSAAVTVHELGGRRRQVHLVWRQDRCEREVLRRLVDSARESFGRARTAARSLIALFRGRIGRGFACAHIVEIGSRNRGSRGSPPASLYFSAAAGPRRARSESRSFGPGSGEKRGYFVGRIG